MASYLLLEDGSRIILEAGSGLLLLEADDPVVEQPSGGWATRGGLDFLGRQQTADEVRKERERLGIVPKQRKIITKAAQQFEYRADEFRGLADIGEIRSAIEHAAEFRAAVDALAIADAERRAAVANFMAEQFMARLFQAFQDEEDDIVQLLIQEM